MESMGVNIQGTPWEIFFSIIAFLISFFWVASYRIHVIEHPYKKNPVPLNEFPPIMLWCFAVYNTTWLILTTYELSSDASGNNSVPKAYHIACLFWSSLFGFFNCYMCLWIYAFNGPVIKNRVCTVLLHWFVFSAVVFSVFYAARFVRPICFVIGIIIGVIMYALPLVMIAIGLKEEPIEGMRVDSIEFSVQLFLNGLAWFIVVLVGYKGAKIDVYIGITNGVGALLGLLQLGVIYRSRNLSANKIHANEGDVPANTIHADEGGV